MADTLTDVLVAGLPGHRRGDERLRGAHRARQGEAGLDRGRHPRHARGGRERRRPADGRQPRPQGDGLGRRRRSRGRPVRPAAAGVGRGRGGRGRGDRQVRRPPGRERDSRQDRREPAAGIGRDHRHLRRRAAARRRAGARGRAAPVGRPGRQEGHRRAEGVARRGDGEVQPGPHGAADPGSELRRDDRAHARRVRRRLDDQHDAVAARGRAERAARADRRRRLRQPVDVRRARLDAGDDAGRRAGPQVQPLPRHRASARRPAPLS